MVVLNSQKARSKQACASSEKTSHLLGLNVVHRKTLKISRRALYSWGTRVFLSVVSLCRIQWGCPEPTENLVSWIDLVTSTKQLRRTFLQFEGYQGCSSVAEHLPSIPQAWVPSLAPKPQQWQTLTYLYRICCHLSTVIIIITVHLDDIFDIGAIAIIVTFISYSAVLLNTFLHIILLADLQIMWRPDIPTLLECERQAHWVLGDNTYLKFVRPERLRH